MNALTGADVYVADQLFATLDTRTRKWTIPGWGDVLLSDTVGFIRDLPHHLVASFNSTLEEARQADLLLHVVDASHPDAEQQMQTVERVLGEIGVGLENFILVLNKVDAVEDRMVIDILRRRYAHSVTISAAKRIGLEKLEAMVAERLAHGFADVEIEASAGNGRLLAFLAEHATVESRDYTDSKVTLRCRLPRQFLHYLSQADVTVRECNGAPVS